MKIDSRSLRASLERERKVELGKSCSGKRLLHFCLMLLMAVFLLYIYIHGSLIDEQALASNFREKFQAPSWMHLFGTDQAGRDMYLRTVKGLATSIQVGLIGTLAGFAIALFFSLLLVLGKKRMDRFVNFIIDAFLSIPHMLFLILISVAAGRGLRGVVLGLALTHWTSLTRILRSEIQEIIDLDYIHLSRALGKSRFYVFFSHVLPHLAPQIIVGLVLLFPHAILHEASMTFLGFGLSLSTPAIGIILQESLKYITAGHLHLAVFPGLLLVLLVMAVHQLGVSLNHYLDPHEFHR